VSHCLALNFLDKIECLKCGACWWGSKCVIVYSLIGVSVIVTGRGSAEVIKRQIKDTRAELRVAFGWFFAAANSLQYLFGKEATRPSYSWI
jgi:hypothetical protein